MSEKMERYIFLSLLVIMAILCVHKIYTDGQKLDKQESPKLKTSVTTSSDDAGSIVLPSTAVPPGVGISVGGGLTIIP